MSAVTQQVILGRGADGGGEAGAEFLLQEADDFAHSLQRESTAAELADDGNGHEFIPGVDAAMAAAAGSNDAALVPPLELAGGDSGEGNHVVGYEVSLHVERISNAFCFKQ